MASPKKRNNLLLSLLTSFFLLGSVLLVAYFVYTFANPYHPLNPLQPPTPPVNPDSGLNSNQPSEVPTDPPLTTVPNQPTDTATPLPTATLTLTNTPTITLEPATLFYAQEGTPDYLPYSGGCTGLYVAGYVADADDNPVMQITVRAEGTLGGEELLIEVLSGSNGDYTVSGWEIKLSNKLIKSRDSITIALYEQDNRIPISEIVTIDTFKDCTQNLAVINFIQE